MNLDSLPDIQKLDVKNTLGSVSNLAEQMQQSWNEVYGMSFLPEFSLCKNIVVAGMGGSALGARAVHTLFADSLRAPFEVVNGYRLPHYVDSNTLLIVSSYSGTTEETIKNLDEGIEKGAQIFVLSTGGVLKDKAHEHNLLSYIFDPKFNPSGQPRLSLGYSTVALIALLSKLSFITVTPEQINKAIEVVKKSTASFDVSSPESANAAKKMARELKNHVPVLVSSEHLFGIAHAIKNQLNESAKTFSTSFDVPELNHHLLEGLKNPAEARSVLKFVFFESHLYSDRVQKRFSVTREVVSKNDASFLIYKLWSENKLSQVFESLTFGSFVSFYLAMLYNIDPSQIPWVDYFKEQMGH